MKLAIIALSVFVSAICVAQVDPNTPSPTTDPAVAAPAAAISPDPAERINELVAIMKAAAQGFGKSADEQAKLEDALRKAAEFCAKHRFPDPDGIDIGVNLDAGFIAGGVTGADLVFAFQKDGTLGVGLFPNVQAQLIVGGAAGGGFTVSLVFNMNTVNDDVGNVMGASGGISLGAGGGLSLNLGISTHDFAGLAESFKAEYKKDGSEEVRDDLGEWLKTLVAPGRMFAVGIGASFGAGSVVTVTDGWAFKTYEKSIALDLNAVEQEAADLHEKLHQGKEDVEKFLIPDGVRNDFDDAKKALQEHHEADERRKEEGKQKLEQLQNHLHDDLDHSPQ